jgi:hypothetical protein
MGSRMQFTVMKGYAQFVSCYWQLGLIAQHEVSRPSSCIRCRRSSCNSKCAAHSLNASQSSSFLCYSLQQPVHTLLAWPGLVPQSPVRFRCRPFTLCAQVHRAAVTKPSSPGPQNHTQAQRIVIVAAATQRHSIKVICTPSMTL